MARALAGYSLSQALARVGLLPPECTDVTLEMPADGTLQLKYTVNLTAEQVPMLAAAIAELAADLMQPGEMSYPQGHTLSGDEPEAHIDE